MRCGGAKLTIENARCGPAKSTIENARCGGAMGPHGDPGGEHVFSCRELGASKLIPPKVNTTHSVAKKTRLGEICLLDRLF